MPEMLDSIVTILEPLVECLRIGDIVQLLMTCSLLHKSINNKTVLAPLFSRYALTYKSPFHLVVRDFDKFYYCPSRVGPEKFILNFVKRDDATQLCMFLEYLDVSINEEHRLIVLGHVLDFAVASQSVDVCMYLTTVIGRVSNRQFMLEHYFGSNKSLLHHIYLSTQSRELHSVRVEGNNDIIHYVNSLSIPWLVDFTHLMSRSVIISGAQKRLNICLEYYLTH